MYLSSCASIKLSIEIERELLGRRRAVKNQPALAMLVTNVVNIFQLDGLYNKLSLIRRKVKRSMG